MTDAAAATVAVTGATGALGGLVARELADRGVVQRLLVRDPARAPELPGASAVRCSYGDRAAARQALVGVDTLFMVSASESADRVGLHRTFVDAARESGVRHIVYTSLIAAAPDCIFTLGRDHYATEQHIAGSGVAHTFLRDNFYLDVLPGFVGDDGVLRGPAGNGHVAAVARQDIARAAAAVLTRPQAHRGLTYDLTGREALTMTDVTRIITEVTGRPARFENETVEQAYRSRQRWNAPDWQVDAWVSTYTAFAAGDFAGISADIAELTGRQPMTLADVLEDHT